MSDYFEVITDARTGETTTRPYTAEEIAAAQAAAPAQVRNQRNSLLQQSDWTQVADAPVDQAAWATYRQALRDVTAQAGFPESISWPVAPE